MGIRSRKWIGMIAVAVLVFGMATIALATATSGRILRGSVSTVYDVCSEAIIADVADNKAFTYSYAIYRGCQSGWGVVSLGGWLGAKALGYRDGSYCGSTGWHYNSGSASGFGVGAKLCTNPSGTQVFKTKADSRGWRPSTQQYVDFLQVTSPNQNY